MWTTSPSMALNPGRRNMLFVMQSRPIRVITRRERGLRKAGSRMGERRRWSLRLTRMRSSRLFMRCRGNERQLKGSYGDQQQAKKLLAKVGKDEQSGEDCVCESVQPGCS